MLVGEERGEFEVGESASRTRTSDDDDDRKLELDFDRKDKAVPLSV